MKSTSAACIICGAKERKKLFSQGEWEIFCCNSCGLGVLDPQPTKEEIIKLYNQEYFTEPGQNGIDPDSKEFAHRLSLESTRIRLVRSQKRQGTVLDIGCGNAYFLAACQKKGFNVHGLDISDYAVEYATQRLKLPVTVGEVDTVTLPENSFDVITMWHYLEHTENPRNIIKKVTPWLKKDGILVVDVPNYEGTDAQKDWENWVGWQLPYHLHHFTENSLKQLLTEMGFKVVKTKTYHSEVVKKQLKKIPIVKILAREVAKFYSGTSVAVVAKRL